MDASRRGQPVVVCLVCGYMCMFANVMFECCRIMHIMCYIYMIMYVCDAVMDVTIYV
jgi:hypothetical protein